MKMYFASKNEQRAVEWVKSNYGRNWAKRVNETVSEAERAFPYPELKHHVARPFGRRDFNSMIALARNCYRRNTHFRKIAREMAV